MTEAMQNNDFRPSLVLVHFASRDLTLPYYNDAFPLRRGDMVYVEGKLEGECGRVVDVKWDFKIRSSDYKRVTAVADTHVSGAVFMGGSHFIAFDRDVLPAEKVMSWYRAPEEWTDEICSGRDHRWFALDDIGAWEATEAVFGRGREYYMENLVRYLQLDGERGYAIVEGSEPYEVSFLYCDGEISHLNCSCYCFGRCKHEAAALMQLRDLLQVIAEQYSQQFAETEYFAAVAKEELFRVNLQWSRNGKICL